MKKRALSIVATAALTACIMGAAAGTAAADPIDPEACPHIEANIEWQLGMLPTVDPDYDARVIESTRILRENSGCDGRPFEELIGKGAPLAAPSPGVQGRVPNSCGEALELAQGQYGAGTEAVYYGLTQAVDEFGKLDRAAGLACIISSQDLGQAVRNTCYYGKSIFPASPIYAGIAELGRAANSLVITELGQSALDSWATQCR